MARLVAYLEEIDDARLLLQHVQKHLDEGKFKQPTDAENQIVQDYASEDVLAALRLLDNVGTPKQEQQTAASKRTTRRTT